MEKVYSLKRRLQVAILFLLLIVSNGYAVTHIKTVANLQAITSNNSYVLDNDLDLSGLTNGLGVGDLTNVTLDGNFHKIMNLTYDGVDRGGLFRNLSGCTIKNLKLTGFTIAGSWAGTLAGHADASTIYRCSSTNGDVESSGIGGGLIGHMSGTSVSESFSSGIVVGHDHVGGLVGHMDNASSILNCYSNSTVTTDSWQVGGIVGWGENAGNTITNCYAAGTVTAGQGFTGGIVGATSGGNKSYVTITNCMGIETNIAANSDIPKTNRIVGDDGSATYTNNYGLATMTWTDPKRTDTWTSDAAGKDGENITATQLASSDFYASKLPTWDFTNVWTLSGAVPKLRMETINSINLTHISTIADLQAITSNNSYVLDNDLDLSGLTNGLGVGDLTNVTLDGNFHKIMNLTYDGVDRGGLFRNLSGCTIKNLRLTGFTIAGSWAGTLAGHADASTIYRCSSTNGDVESSGIGGGLIGHMSGTSVSESFSSGIVVGHDHVGGLVGHMDNASSILNCYSNSTVTTDSWQVGGIVGWGENAGNTITNCYAAGTVTAGQGFTGGIVGATSGGNKSYVTITNCMGIETNIAANSDIPKTNRIVGDDGSATYTNNYGLATMTWTDPKRTDTWTSDAAGKDGENITATQLASSDFYASKLPTWDFTNVWALSGAVPKLRMETMVTAVPRVVSTPNAIVYVSDGSICIATTENANISIYNLSGVKLIQANSKSSIERFNVKGIAIVKVVTAAGTNVYKVMNQ